jgi:phosphoglucomutase/phosphopentomutase
MSSLEASVAEFLCWIPRQDYRDQIQQLIDAAQHTQISELFASRLSFGTAGLRGAMGPGYCRMNELVVLQTTQGLVQAVLEQHQNQRKIAIVGYDARHNSKAYANVCARVFVDAGFKVYLFSGYCGTPFVPFAVRFYNALAGVMITASHNPKQDNGYKV